MPPFLGIATFLSLCWAALETLHGLPHSVLSGWIPEYLWWRLRGGRRGSPFVSQGGRCRLHEDINSGTEQGIFRALCQLCSGREQEDVGQVLGTSRHQQTVSGGPADGQGEPKLPSQLLL